MLGDLVAQTLIGALMLLGAWEHLLHVLSHGLVIVTVAVSSRQVVLQQHTCYVSFAGKDVRHGPLSSASLSLAVQVKLPRYFCRLQPHGDESTLQIIDARARQRRCWEPPTQRLRWNVPWQRS